MNRQKDVRWEKRFSNYVKAFDKLDQGFVKIKEDYQIVAQGTINKDEFLNDIIKDGFIQRFKSNSKGSKNLGIFVSTYLR